MKSTITGASGQDLLVGRAVSWCAVPGAMCCSSICTAAWPSACWIELALQDYRNENDLYRAASQVSWEVV